MFYYLKYISINNLHKLFVFDIVDKQNLAHLQDSNRILVVNTGLSDDKIPHPQINVLIKMLFLYHSRHFPIFIFNYTLKI
jgi:hypothetical protein